MVMKILSFKMLCLSKVTRCALSSPCDCVLLLPIGKWKENSQVLLWAFYFPAVFQMATFALFAPRRQNCLKIVLGAFLS